MNYNTSSSDYSSGCESGWTMYLDHYSTGLYQEEGAYAHAINHDEEDDDEDLSMVSDASSGPPLSRHFVEEKTKKKNLSKCKKETKKQQQQQQQSLCLDDTASSSVFHFSQDNVPRSDDRNSAGNIYSAADFESESKKRLNFFKSSTKGKSRSLLGRKRQ